MELHGRVKKIIDSFDVLKKILSDRAVVGEDEILIFDPPYEIRILKNEGIVVFNLGDEDIAVLSEDECRVKEGCEELVKEWILALSSLSFKRFVLKNR